MIRMWSIIDGHAIDKHGDQPIIDDFCIEHILSIESIVELIAVKWTHIRCVHTKSSLGML